jgi:hypothetical protein
MTNKRKAAIGYATYVLGGRVARRVVRRRTRRFLGRLEATPRRRSRRLPLIGGAAAVAGAAVAGAVAVRRHRAADTD